MKYYKHLTSSTCVIAPDQSDMGPSYEEITQEEYINLQEGHHRSRMSEEPTAEEIS